MRRVTLAVLLATGMAGTASAQKPVPKPAAGIIGTWEFDARHEPALTGPRVVIVRDDSSASWGTENARWRIKADRLWLAVGGDWEDYRMKLKGSTLTLSEGDLKKPISFRRIGPSTPRPAGVAVPPDPDTVRR